MGGWEYLEVFVKASERQQADAGIVLAGQTFTTVEHFYTRKLNELGAQGWELLSEELQGGDFYRLLFKRRAAREFVPASLNLCGDYARRASSGSRISLKLSSSQGKPSQTFIRPKSRPVTTRKAGVVSRAGQRLNGGYPSN